MHCDSLHRQHSFNLSNQVVNRMRSSHTDGVSKTDFITAHFVESPHNSHHIFGRHLPRERAAKHSRDIPANNHSKQSRFGCDGRKHLEALVNTSA